MKYYTIDELCKSSSATRYGIDNTPSYIIREHLTELVDNLLDPLREKWGSPIKVNSGYRSKELNAKIGGSSPTSAHVLGYAADIVPANGKMKEFQQFVENFLKGYGKWDQLIHEKRNKGIDRWIHVGYKNNKGEQRKQIIIT